MLNQLGERVIIDAFKEGGQWVARCKTPIAHAAQGDTVQEAIRLCLEGVYSDMKFAAENGTRDDADSNTDKSNENELRKQFYDLAKKWKQETAHLSNMTNSCNHSAYQKIIGMGKDIIPFILRDLKETQDHWFWALLVITGINPVSEDHAGNIEYMTEAWLQWGRSEGYDI